MKYLYVIFSIIFSFTLNIQAQSLYENWKLGSNGWQLVNHTQRTDEKSESGNTLNVNSNLDSVVFEIEGVSQALLYLRDLQNDGVKEYIVSCCKPNAQAQIYIFDENGNLLSGFPFNIPRSLSYPAKVSLYGQGKMALTYCEGINGYLLGINTSGVVEIPEVEFGGSITILPLDPVVADITGDGHMDLILLYGNAPLNTSTLVFYDTYKQEIVHKFLLPYSQITPAVGDIDGDGVNEVIHETGMFWDPGVLLWAFEGDGSLMPGWPKSFSPSTLFAGVFLADFMGDSRPEIVLQLSEYTLPTNEYIRLLSPEGEELRSFNFHPVQWGWIPMTALGKKEEDTLSGGNPPILIQVREKHLYFTNLVDSTVQYIALDKVPDEIKTFRAVQNNEPSTTQLITAAVQTGSNYSTVNIMDSGMNIVKQLNIFPAYDVQVTDQDDNGYLDILYTAFNLNKYYVYAVRDFYGYDKNKIEWPESMHDCSRTCNYESKDPFIPVELLRFTFSVENNSVNLFWTTVTETNNQGFVIERRAVCSERNGDFDEIGFVEGKGTTTERQSYGFTDIDLEPGRYTYRLKQIDNDGSFEYSVEVKVEINIPNEYVLYQNYPNPFNPKTTIRYNIPAEGLTILTIYDLLGREITKLVNEVKGPGRYETELDAGPMASGVYFYKLNSGRYTSVRKMQVMR